MPHRIDGFSDPEEPLEVPLPRHSIGSVSHRFASSRTVFGPFADIPRSRIYQVCRSPVSAARPVPLYVQDVDISAYRMYTHGMSTTIRIDSDTHARLLQLSQATGTTLIEPVRDATEALRRQRFAHQVAAELAELRNDPVAWEAYLSEANTTSVTDGIG